MYGENSRVCSVTRAHVTCHSFEIRLDGFARGEKMHHEAKTLVFVVNGIASRHDCMEQMVAVVQRNGFAGRREYCGKRQTKKGQAEKKCASQRQNQWP